MKYVTAVAPNFKFFKETVDLAKEQGANVEELYENIIVTPIFAEKKFLWYLGELKEQGIVKNVIFDSGGFQVKTGRKFRRKPLTFKKLLEVNNELYLKHDFADWLILPDDSPLGADPEHIYLEKCNQTIKLSSEFFNQLPDRLKEKSIPCFHVKSLKYFDLFYEGHYPIINQTKYAACSIHSCGHDKTINLNALLIIDHINKELQKENINLHLLGIGSPSMMYILNHVNLHSADSSAADIRAIYYEITFPFRSNIIISDRKKNPFTQEDLERLKETTDHSCVFCEDIEKLREDKKYLTLHNRTVAIEMLQKHAHLDTNTFFEKVTNVPLRKAFREFLSIKGELEQGQLF